MKLLTIHIILKIKSKKKETFRPLGRPERGKAMVSYNEKIDILIEDFIIDNDLDNDMKKPLICLIRKCKYINELYLENIIFYGILLCSWCFFIF